MAAERIGGSFEMDDRVGQYRNLAIPYASITCAQLDGLDRDRPATGGYRKPVDQLLGG
jgi:hypothetical protein